MLQSAKRSLLMGTDCFIVLVLIVEGVILHFYVERVSTSVDCPPVKRLLSSFLNIWLMMVYLYCGKYCGTKTLSHPWRPYKLTRSRSPCARKSWRVSVLASRVVSTELFFPVCTFPRKFQCSERKPYRHNNKLPQTAILMTSKLILYSSSLVLCLKKKYTTCFEHLVRSLVA